VKRRSLMRLATPLMIGRGISAVITFSIPIALARHLPQETYGTYKQFFLIAATTYLIGQAGLTASLYYFLPRDREDRGRYLIQALMGLFVIGALAAAIVFFGGAQIARRFSNPELSRLALPLAIYLWAFLGAAPLEISLTATKRTGLSGLCYVLSDLARTAALTAPVYTGRGMYALAWGAVVFAGVRLAVAWAAALSGRIVTPRLPTRRTVKAQLAYSLPFAGAVLLATVQMQFPQYAVAALTDAATYAIYAVGVLQIPLTDMLYTPVAEVMMVRLAQTSESGAPAIFREAVARLALFFLPLTAFALAAAPILLPTLYTAAYTRSVPIFMIALSELPLSGLPVDGLLRSLNSTRTIFWINLGRLTFTLAAVPAGLWALGLPGAMLGYIATQWLAKMCMLAAAARRLRVRVGELLPRPILAWWAVRAGVVYLAVEAIRLRGPWRGVHFLVAAGAAALVIWLLSLLTAGELRRSAGGSTSILAGASDASFLPVGVSAARSMSSGAMPAVTGGEPGTQGGSGGAPAPSGTTPPTGVLAASAAEASCG
jgi:O-antigen/teichoic acid export membrane protein